jgi:hypothetical protein
LDYRIWKKQRAAERKASKAINRRFTQMDTDSFSARMAETCPDGHEN